MNLKNSLIVAIALMAGTTFAQEEELSRPPDVLPLQEEKPGNAEIIEFPDIMAEFPGGMKGLTEYIQTNFRYPTDAVEKNIQGRVFVGFVVEKDGSISNVKVKRGVGFESVDNEAIRLVSNMPKWTPGVVQKEIVRTYYTLPINFTLEGPQGSK